HRVGAAAVMADRFVIEDAPSSRFVIEGETAPPKTTAMPPAPKGPLIPGSPIRSALTAGVEGVKEAAQGVVTGGTSEGAAIQALATSMVPGGWPARAAVLGAKGGAPGLLNGEGLSGAGW